MSSPPQKGGQERGGASQAGGPQGQGAEEGSQSGAAPPAGQPAGLDLGGLIASLPPVGRDVVPQPPPVTSTREMFAARKDLIAAALKKEKDEAVAQEKEKAEEVARAKQRATREQGSGELQRKLANKDQTGDIAMSGTIGPPGTRELRTPQSSIKPLELENVDFRAILQNKRQRCAFQVDDLPIVGHSNPGDEERKVWGPTIVIDPGKYGTARVTLGFDRALQSITGVMSNVPVLEQPQVSWCPGLVTYGEGKEPHYQMAKTYWHTNWSQKEREGKPYPAKVMAAVTEEVMDKMICLEFKSTCATVRNFTPKESTKHTADAMKSVEALGNSRIHTVRVWYKMPAANLYQYMTRSLNDWQRAQKAKWPPLVQYYEQDRTLQMGIWGTPEIERIGSKMYRAKGNDPTNGFYQFPQHLGFSSLEEAEIFNSLTPIREAQYKMGLLSRYQKTPVRVFVMSLPHLETFAGEPIRVDRTSATATEKSFRDSFRLLIRLEGKRGDGEEGPQAGQRVEVTFDKTDINPSPKKWKGLIVDGYRDQLRDTSTDFACLMQRPQGEKTPRSYTRPEMVKSRALPPAKLTIYANVAVEKDALKSVRGMFKSTMPQRLAICQILQQTNPVTEKVKFGYPGDASRFEAHVRACQVDPDENKRINASQMKALMQHPNAENGVVVTIGPAGCGKTLALAVGVWAHENAKVLQFVGGSSNYSVNEITKAIFRHRPAGKEGTRIIRIGVNSVTGAEILRHLRSEGEGKTSTAQREFEETVEYRHYFQSLLNAHAEDGSRWARIAEREKDLKEAWKQFQQGIGAEVPDIPVETTMDWHVNQLIREDQQAQEEADHAWVREDPIKNQITSPAQERMPSGKYLKLLKKLAHQEGLIDNKLKKQFWEERAALERRVLKGAQIVLATVSNSISLKGIFNPHVLHIDEASQMTIASWSVPLTTFDNWSLCSLNGDHEQMTATILGARANEVLANSKLSPLAVTVLKDHSNVMLTTQYRMCPPISQWLSEFWYKGLVVDAPIVLVDNHIREAVRQVSREKYGIKGKDGDGSEYFVINVVLGRSRVEENGNSQVNFANADAATDLVQHFVDAGLKAEEICVITFYRGQKNVVLRKIIDRAKGRWAASALGEISEGSANMVNWSTADAAQGSQYKVTIVDYVAANPAVLTADVAKAASEQKRRKAEKAREIQRLKDNGDDAGLLALSKEKQEAGDYGYVTSGCITGHVTNPHRSCVALSRGRFGTVVICQAESLLNTFNPNREARRNAVSTMIADADKRKLMFDDTTHLDTHPQALQEAASQDAKAAQRRRDAIVKERLRFIPKMIAKVRAHKPKAEEEEDDEADVYAKLKKADEEARTKRLLAPSTKDIHRRVLSESREDDGQGADTDVDEADVTRAAQDEGNDAKKKVEVTAFDGGVQAPEVKMKEGCEDGEIEEEEEVDTETAMDTDTLQMPDL